MRKYGLTLGIAGLFVLGTAQGLVAQVEALPSAEKKIVAEDQVIEIIQLAESKLYSPVREGLKDLSFTQQLALDKRLRTYWFKAPDKAKSIFGRPTNFDPEEEKKKPKLLRRKNVELLVPSIVTDRTLGWMMGKPISCLLPYGKIEIVRKDESGTQIRFTVDAMAGKKLVWSHVDFYLDADFLITKIIEKAVSDGRIEEHRITMKPYKENAKLMLLDKDTVISGTEKFQKTAELKYEYAPIEGFWLRDRIEMTIPSEQKKFTEKYLDYKVNRGIDDDVFVER